MDNKKVFIPKVFISYSWASPLTEKFVLDLSQRLSGNGVKVILDKWDLKGGQDKYVFMEQIVKDDTIDKVLIISDKEYTKNANNRTGGVGVETSLLSHEIYKEYDQTKYLPIVVASNENGEPTLPFFLKNCIHLNFVENNNFEEVYFELLRILFNKPIYEKPPIGKPPFNIMEDMDNHIQLTVNCNDEQKLKNDLLIALKNPFKGTLCQWQVKESQVLIGKRNPAAIGYYPVLIGLEKLLNLFPDESMVLRDEIIDWSLSEELFDNKANWFIDSSSINDPLDPVVYDIRHTAEVGLALLFDGRALERTKKIIENIIDKQGNSCDFGAWKSNEAKAAADPLSTVICAELIAYALKSSALININKDKLYRSLTDALMYLENSKYEKGWRYEGLKEDYWEVWGASIVGFRLREFLTENIKKYVIKCISNELIRTDLLIGGYGKIQRVKLLTRYLCALHALNWSDKKIDTWKEVLADLWLNIDPDYKDISTRLHLSFLFLKRE